MLEPCQHPRQEKRKRTKSNGVVVVVMQCLDCGDPGRELPKAGEIMARLPEFDPTIQERKQLELQEHWRQERESQSSQFWTDYNIYLKTPHWQRIHRIVLARDPVCQVCFSRPSEQAHHLSYESLRRYRVSFSVECVGVCEDCHFKRLHPEKDQHG